MLRVRRSLAGTIGVLVTLACSPAFADVPSCLQAAERAQPLRRSGELRQARAQLITCSATSCPRAVRADCTRWLNEVEIALPSVVIQARDASGVDVVDVTVSIDGVVQQRALDGLAIAVDPGTRVLKFEAPGRDATQQTLVVREGEKNRVVPVVLSRPGGVGRPALAPAPIANVAVAGGRNGLPVGAWILGGAGLLAIGGGVALWARGVSERDDLRGECASAASCVQGDIDAAKTKLVIGDVLVGVGALAVVAGVWLALRSGSSASTAVMVGPRGVGVLHPF